MVIVGEVPVAAPEFAAALTVNAVASVAGAVRVAEAMPEESVVDVAVRVPPATLLDQVTATSASARMLLYASCVCAVMETLAEGMGP